MNFSFEKCTVIMCNYQIRVWGEEIGIMGIALELSFFKSYFLNEFTFKAFAEEETIQV